MKWNTKYEEEDEYKSEMLRVPDVFQYLKMQVR